MPRVEVLLDDFSYLPCIALDPVFREAGVGEFKGQYHQLQIPEFLLRFLVVASDMFVGDSLFHSFDLDRPFGFPYLGIMVCFTEIVNARYPFHHIALLFGSFPSPVGYGFLIGGISFPQQLVPLLIGQCFPVYLIKVLHSCPPVNLDIFLLFCQTTPFGSITKISPQSSLVWACLKSPPGTFESYLLLVPLGCQANETALSAFVF